jgi:hypothetical protein
LKLEISLIAAPYQETVVVLNGQRCRIRIQQLTDGVFLWLWINGLPIKMGVICQNNVYLIKNNHFIGDLYFQDFAGFDNPDYLGFGGRFKLIYGDIYETLPLPPRKPEPVVTSGFLLQDNGFYILQDDGGRIIV